jgi:hypothetical protein
MASIARQSCIGIMSSANSTSNYITPELLDETHHKALSRAVDNVLDTSLALFTYAQILDGLPTQDVAWDWRFTRLHSQHPINLHTQICPGAEKKAQSFKTDFSIDILKYKPQVSFMRISPI